MADETPRRIGELARDTGITVRTLHHYDQLGLLRPSSRTPGGHRCYDSSDVVRLHRIIVLRSFGLSLEEIGQVLDAEPDQDAGELVRHQLAVVEERIRQSSALRARLLGVLAALESSAEPSTEQFLHLVEETMTMIQPLTPEQVGKLIESRRAYAGGLDDAELTTMGAERSRRYDELSQHERDELRERLRQLPLPAPEQPS
ncbi:MerR family transcriptional regulator [Microlunatus ginsengisoli]|uniref:MerR family transcriptional regulator n=1 Tax=Microlunatus ginsengisoli TaxID=363863 RepID=A0ABP7AGQ4_9ACTN